MKTRPGPVAPHAPSAPEELAQLTIEVPPDRAIIHVRVEGSHESFDEAAREVRAGIARLNDRLEDQTGCASRVVDYGAPRRDDADIWTGWAAIEITIELSGVTEVVERMARLDACLGRLRPDEDAAPAKGRTKIGRRLTTGDPLLIVDNPDRYRALLLEQVTTRLKAAGAAEAPQWAPRDLRCTSDGVVVVRARCLGGIRLGLALDAEVVRPARPSDA